MDELLARGIKSVPVTIWDDQVVIGFNPTALARLFALSGTVAVVDLPTMLEKYEIVLNAACRTFRQRSSWIPGSWHLRLVYTDDISCRDRSQESNRAGQHQASRR